LRDAHAGVQNAHISAGDKPAWNGDGAIAAVSITFDNLGEAAELELGVWPEDQPLGRHFSVQEALPRLLELLSSLSVHATFFVEGMNAEMYPDALRELVERGHEVATHAWRHEQWGDLDRASEERLLRRATEAMKAAGLAPAGFRPPGGRLTADTPALLTAHGYSYVSPAGEREGIREGLAVLPFRWPLVDAYSFMPQFAGLRERFRGSGEPFGPDEVSRTMRTALAEHAEQGGHLALLFHPFAVAATGEVAWAGLEEVLQAALELVRDRRVCLLRMDEAGRWMRDHPADFRSEPELDDATWMTASR
jgi:peptidoglycan/xylan/chitin deacetylase (PgdA/CDA1 family)